MIRVLKLITIFICVSSCCGNKTSSSQQDDNFTNLKGFLLDINGEFIFQPSEEVDQLPFDVLSQNSFRIIRNRNISNTILDYIDNLSDLGFTRYFNVGVTQEDEPNVFVSTNVYYLFCELRLSNSVIDCIKDAPINCHYILALPEVMNSRVVRCKYCENITTVKFEPMLPTEREQLILYHREKKLTLPEWYQENDTE